MIKITNYLRNKEVIDGALNSYYREAPQYDFVDCLTKTVNINTNQISSIAQPAYSYSYMPSNEDIHYEVMLHEKTEYVYERKSKLFGGDETVTKPVHQHEEIKLYEITMQNGDKFIVDESDYLMVRGAK